MNRISSPAPGSALSPAARRAGIALAVTVVVTAAVILLFGRGAYDWIKAVHVIAIISWMAGLLYLPRLFIYHCDAPAGSDQDKTFALMEARLLNIIMTPAMIVAWVLGLWLAVQAGWLAAGWFHAKLAMALGLSAVHGYFAGAARRFAEGRNTVSPRHWRMINEIPTLLMIVIVILVIVKPF